MYDVIIVGAGPAGLTAAIYARRASKTVLVLEAKAWGGQIINTPDIENYPVVAHISGADFANELYNQALALGAEVKLEKVIGVEDLGKIKKVRSTLAEYEAGAVILATGSENRKLGLDREQELTGRGVSYCATCDGNFFRNKDVAVVGGGNTALEDALYLADLANKVYLIHRRDAFRGEETTVDRLRQRENVEIIYNATVTALLGEKRLSGIEVTDKITGGKRSIELKGLFVAVGRIPENESFSALIDLDQAGYAVAGENCRTKVPGVFVAGDNRTKEVRQLVTAAADGAVAATEAVKFLNA
ncbi:MAG: thioredoxin-disulfide reductase [Oscillospiraceae bacterium]|nr:thioredoxin-disulfide reductase [Oscillospiraceae bacterium]